MVLDGALWSLKPADHKPVQRQGMAELDKTRLAFAGARDGHWNVWSVGRDGAGLLQMTDYGDEHHYVRNPEWSPTGDRLVYEFASFAGNVWTIKIR